MIFFLQQVVNWLGKLSDEDQTIKDCKNYRNVMLGQLQFLSGFVDDLLDLGMLKSGTFSLARKAFDITGVVSLVNMIFAPQAQQKGVKFKTQVQGVDISDLHYSELPSLIPKLVGDERRVKQILMNLVRNAIKFTHSGFIYLRVLYNGMLTIEVQDTGTGIAREDMPQLFTRFGKLMRTAKINNEGIGLGLNIVK